MPDRRSQPALSEVGSSIIAAIPALALRRLLLPNVEIEYADSSRRLVGQAEDLDRIPSESHLDRLHDVVRYGHADLEHALRR